MKGPFLAQASAAHIQCRDASGINDIEILPEVGINFYECLSSRKRVGLEPQGWNCAKSRRPEKFEHVDLCGLGDHSKAIEILLHVSSSHQEVVAMFRSFIDSDGIDGLDQPKAARSSMVVE